MTEENTTVVNDPIESREPDAQTEGRVQTARGGQANYLHADESPFVEESNFVKYPEDDELQPPSDNNPYADIELNREPALPVMITWQELIAALHERMLELPESLHADFASQENDLRDRIMKATGNDKLDPIEMGQIEYGDVLNATTIPEEFIHDIRRFGIKPFKEGYDSTANTVDHLKEVIDHVRDSLAIGKLAVLSNSDVVEQQAHHVMFTVGRTKLFNLPEIVIIGAPVDLTEHIIEYMVQYNVSVGDHRECSIGGAINRITGQDIVLANLKRSDLTWLVDGLITNPSYIERNVRLQSGMDDIFNIIYDDQPVVIDILSSIVFPWVQEPYGAYDKDKNQSDLALLQVLASFDYESINLDTVESAVGTEPANDV